MFLSWNGKNKKLLTSKKKPSPTYKSKYPDSARNPDNPLRCGTDRRSRICRFMKGTSLFAFFSKKISAGMTVEAAVVLPLFLFFFLNLGCVMEMIRLHGNLQLSLWQIGSMLSVYGYALDSGELPGEEDNGEEWWKELAGNAASAVYVKRKLATSAGEDYLERSPLVGGADGLQLWESQIFGGEDEVDILVTYWVSPLSSLAGFPSFRMANRYYAHIWNGYRLSGGTGNEEEDRTVYITENGTVYHLNRECSHLQLSIRQVNSGQIDEERNQHGGRFRPCEKCAGGGMPGILYITQEGDRYHYSRECSGLKRTVFSMTLKEALEEGYRSCSRCGG